MAKRWRGFAACLAGYGLGVAAWLAVIAAGVAVFQGPSFWQWPREVAERIARILLFESEYGYEFLLATTHLWGSVGAILVFSRFRGRPPLLSGTAGWWFGLACLAMVLGSLRWLWGELVAIYPGGGIGSSPFHEGLDRRVLFALPAAFLAAVAWAGWRRRRRKRNEAGGGCPDGLVAIGREADAGETQPPTAVILGKNGQG